MFETTKIILTNNKKNLFKKLRESPVLYLFFIGMMIFSVVMFAFMTYFLTFTDFEINVQGMFLGIFFIFMIKSVIDFYNYFIKSKEVSFTLSTPKKQVKTVFEIFLAVLLTELFIWFVLSISYLFILSTFGVNTFYPIEYLFFTIGIISSVFLGTTISIHFFQSKKYRLIPTGILLSFIFYSQSLLYVFFVFPVCIIHFLWALKHAMFSYLFVNRKKRSNGQGQLKLRNIFSAIIYRETIVLWRERLFYSFVFTAVSTGLITGYLFLNGVDLLIPESLEELAAASLPSVFIFLGVYIVVVYTSVFPGLNLFLNEEKTMWILRNLPVKNDTLVFGKTFSLSLCFLTTIPFISYISPFIGLNNIFYLLWFLSYSYIAGVIISVPLGAKYVGKKSDILLLYSVAMILFGVLGFGTLFGRFVGNNFEYPIFLYIFVLLVELIVLYGSLKLSSRILS